ncbi:hypothetical protein L1887_42449 [Cichorium endivia]|nr:hypothetical protein L1887_42449 [Cichorium endivia]
MRGVDGGEEDAGSTSKSATAVYRSKGRNRGHRPGSRQGQGGQSRCRLFWPTDRSKGCKGRTAVSGAHSRGHGWERREKRRLKRAPLRQPQRCKAMQRRPPPTRRPLLREARGIPKPLAMQATRTSRCSIATTKASRMPFDGDEDVLAPEDMHGWMTGNGMEGEESSAKGGAERRDHLSLSRPKVRPVADDAVTALEARPALALYVLGEDKVDLELGDVEGTTLRARWSKRREDLAESSRASRAWCWRQEQGEDDALVFLKFDRALTCIQQPWRRR